MGGICYALYNLWVLMHNGGVWKGNWLIYNHILKLIFHILDEEAHRSAEGLIGDADHFLMSVFWAY